MQKTRALYDIWFQRSETAEQPASRTAEQSVLLKSLGTHCQLRQIDYADHENDSHSLPKSSVIEICAF